MSQQADALPGWVPYIKVDDGSLKAWNLQVVATTALAFPALCSQTVRTSIAMISRTHYMILSTCSIASSTNGHRMLWCCLLVTSPELPFSHIGSIDLSNAIASRWYPNIRRDTEWFTALVNLHKLQGRDGVWFAGNELTINSHEMAMVTGMVVADALGAPYPYSHARSAKRNFIAVRNLMLHGMHQFWCAINVSQTNIKIGILLNHTKCRLCRTPCISSKHNFSLQSVTNLNTIFLTSSIFRINVNFALALQIAF